MLQIIKLIMNRVDALESKVNLKLKMMSDGVERIVFNVKEGIAGKLQRRTGYDFLVILLICQVLFILVYAHCIGFRNSEGVTIYLQRWVCVFPGCLIFIVYLLKYSRIFDRIKMTLIVIVCCLTLISSCVVLFLWVRYVSGDLVLVETLGLYRGLNAAESHFYGGGYITRAGYMELFLLDWYNPEWLDSPCTIEDVKEHLDKLHIQWDDTIQRVAVEEESAAHNRWVMGLGALIGILVVVSLKYFT